MSAPRLTDDHIEKAVRLLGAWQGKLTWDQYLIILSGELGHKYSKMAMHKHPKVMAAWVAAKSRLQASGLGTVYGNQVIAQAKKRISELEARVERLEKENEQHYERFQRWAYNAREKNLTPEDLDKDLPFEPRNRK